MRRLLGRTLLAVVMSVAAAGAAAAQQHAGGQSPNKSEYDSLIDNALNEYRLGHWIEAKAYFTQAHALQPNARTLRGLGLVCYELRKYVEAIGYFQQALANPTRPLTSEMRAGVDHLLHEAERFVSRVELTITPSDAALAVDGRPVQRGAQGRILVDAGTHELTAEAAGYEATTRALTTDGGETMRLTVALHSTEQNLAEVPPPPPPEPQPLAQAQTADEPDDTDSVLPWVVIAGSSVVMITGGVLLGIALSDKAKIEDTPKGSAAWSEVEDAYERVPVFSAVGAVMLGVGAAGVAAGLAWKFWPDASDERTPTAKLRVTPGGLTFRAQF